MQRAAWTPLLDRDWQQVSRCEVSGPYSWAPFVEVRRSRGDRERETWFHVVSADGPILKRFSTRSIPDLMKRWRPFVIRCEAHQPDRRDVGLLSGFVGKIILEDKLWHDDKGRTIGILQLIQGGFRQGDTGLRIKLDVHSSATTIAGFAMWLDALDELHQPFLTELT